MRSFTRKTFAGTAAAAGTGGFGTHVYRKAPELIGTASAGIGMGGKSLECS